MLILALVVITDRERTDSFINHKALLDMLLGNSIFPLKLSL